MKMKILLMLVIVLGTLTNCQAPDKNLYEAESLSYFTNGTDAKYYVQQNAAEGYKIEVGITEQASFDRSITVEVNQTESTANPLSYQLSNTLFIPANSNIGYVEVIGNYSSVQDGSKIVFDLKNVQSSNVATFKNKFTLELFQFCPLVRDDFIGTWDADEDGSPPYQVKIIAGAAYNEIIVMNYYDGDPNSTTTIFLNDTEPGNFVLDYPPYLENYLFDHPRWGALYISSGRGTFDACTKVIDSYFKAKLFDGREFSEAHIKLTKQ